MNETERERESCTCCEASQVKSSQQKERNVGMTLLACWILVTIKMLVVVAFLVVEDDDDGKRMWIRMRSFLSS